jgi:hypothetical protein
MSLDTEFKYFYPKKLSQSSQKYGLDTGSGIRKKIIPDTGSWGPKKTGSGIPNPDPQHWVSIFSN